MPSPKHLRVFLASPSDVADERALALQVLDRLPYDPLLRGRVTIEAVAWDKPGSGTPMLATMTPQAAIAAGLPKPSECDIVVVIVWSRMGTPLPDEYRKPAGGRYVSGTEWEYLDALEGTKRCGAPEIVVYRRTEKCLLDPNEPEFDEKLRQRRNADAFFAAFRNPDGSIRSGYNEYAAPEIFRQQLDLHLRAVIGRILKTGPMVAPTLGERSAGPGPPLWQGSPFPGLRAFTPDDAPIFFGRGRETDELVRRFADPATHFVLVVGASGSGKSSLVAAGLIPRLKGNAVEGSRDWLLPGMQPIDQGDRRMWAGLRFTPGEVSDNPFEALAIRLAPLLPGATLQPRKLAVALQARPNALPEFVAQALQGRPSWAEALLFVDQFEELFSVAAAPLRAPFVAMLAAAVQAPCVRIIATVRADFYHRCVEEQPALADILAQRSASFPLTAPGLGAVWEMITAPAGRAGLEFEEGLPSRILDDTGTAVGGLALLAFALHELYEARTADGGLTSHAYDAFGGVRGAIGRRAEATFAQATFEEARAVRRAFLSLVGMDEEFRYVRRPTVWSQLPAESHSLLERFIEARLLVSSRNESGERTLEVAHEALFLHWPLLRGWLKDHREDLKVRGEVHHAAQDWLAHGQDEGYLVHRGRRLAEASVLEGNSFVELGSLDMAYLEECRTAQKISNGNSLSDLSETGWGVIFAADADEWVRTALDPLLAHRRQQATKTRPGGYREFCGASGYRPEESAWEFLARQGVALGNSDWNRVPHYLLIVGDPKTIPFEFQYALSTIYAVGRVHFPSQEEYTAYAKSIVASETGQLTLARRVAVFAPQHEDDRAAKHTVTEFVTPLIKSLTAGQRGWSVRTYLQEHGTKAELAGLLGGPETPALLFATGHGMQYLSGDPAQLSRQGALVCSDWQRGPIAAEQIFAAADVAADARLLGVIAFIVGPYTAGTPEYAESLNLDIGFVEARPIAPHAFLARLPQRLLGHPEGGALGIVGHVERTWSGGFSGAKGGHEVDLFARVLQRLMQGAPLGAAMRPLFQRYADYAAQMPQEFEKVLNGRSRSQDRARFSRQLRAFYDARDYLILGDPAVRLMSTEEDPAIPSDPTTAGEAEPVIRNETEGS